MMQLIGSIAISGLSGQRVDVEVDIATGIPAFSIVGLGDTAVQESRERVRSAIKNSGYAFPSKRITVNLAPADTRKSGPSFDLPIALGILLGDGIASERDLSKTYFLGELALDGKIREITGVLPAILFAKSHGAECVVIPAGNLDEASLVAGIHVLGANSLNEVVAYVEKTGDLIVPAPRVPKERNKSEVDFSSIKGQDRAKRALLIAAAGGHNILLDGPPGSGKTMLAKALEGILPDMSFDEVLDVSKIYSVAGLLDRKTPLIENRPFRKIHHTASAISIIGGGAKSRPGEVSLAHRGVLFLDEFLEFDSHLIEMLRQPLEDGTITVTRVHASFTYPAKFLLIGAMNPCPCGYLGDPDKACSCSERDIEKYRAKLSGPILDRIDLFVHVPRIKVEEIDNARPLVTTEELRERVEKARAHARKRFLGLAKECNSEITPKEVEKLCYIRPDGMKMLKDAMNRLSLSMRSYYRLIRVARTIADLEDAEEITLAHVAEALSYRGEK